MQEPENSRVEQAAGAGTEEIQQLVHDLSARVIRALLQNPNLEEEHVAVIAGRTNLPSDILESIAKDRRWSDKYAIRLAIVRNPRSPLTISLSLVRFLRLFDLEEITRNRAIPLVLRNKVEAMITERVPTMPLGNKKTLAKKAAGNVLLKLLQERLPEVVALCLNNPHLVEAHLYKVISRRETIADTIVQIGNHPRWSTRSLIRFALIRNEQTPLAMSAGFLGSMKLGDLRELYQDPTLPVTVRPFVHRELVERGKDPFAGNEEQVYEISEEELEDIEATLEMQERSAAEEAEEGRSTAQGD